jgi:hypothetical protein
MGGRIRPTAGGCRGVDACPETSSVVAEVISSKNGASVDRGEMAVPQVHDPPPRTEPTFRRRPVILVTALVVAPLAVLAASAVALGPLMSSAMQVSNEFFDDVRAGHPADELLCPSSSRDLTTAGPRWMEEPGELFRRPPGPPEVPASTGQYLSQVGVSGTIGEGVATGTVSGRLNLSEDRGGQARSVSVRLHLLDGQWCVHDVWFETSRREAIRRS